MLNRHPYILLISLEIFFITFTKKCTNKPVKRFQMKSNGCRDVQHIGLQSTQTRRNTGKQGAQTRGTRSAHLPKHPYISGCIIIVGYANQFKVTKIEEKIFVANQFKVTKIENMASGAVLESKRGGGTRENLAGRACVPGEILLINIHEMPIFCIFAPRFRLK